MVGLDGADVFNVVGREEVFVTVGRLVGMDDTVTEGTFVVDLVGIEETLFEEVGGVVGDEEEIAVGITVGGISVGQTAIACPSPHGWHCE